MELTQEQERKVQEIIEKITNGNPALKESPSTRVMAFNLLNTYGWDLEKAIKSLD